MKRLAAEGLNELPPFHPYTITVPGACAGWFDLIERHAPDLVAVFASDQVYRMDVRQMVQFHSECGADVTDAATQVPIALASSFGVIAAGQKGEIVDFQEKNQNHIV